MHILHHTWLTAHMVLSVILYTILQGGRSALMYAAIDGYTEVVTQLLKAGANADLQSKV